MAQPNPPPPQPAPEFFLGVDWGSRTHQACLINLAGQVVGQQAFPHSGRGLNDLADWSVDHGGGDAARIQAAIETPHGPVVDTLTDRGLQVLSINPKQLDRFRDRFSPSGCKDDRRDARVLAEAVRLQPDCLRQHVPLSEEEVQLREWLTIRDEVVERRTRCANRLQQQLWRYFPELLLLNVSLTEGWMLELWQLVPTPDRARRVRRASVEKLLRRHRIRRFKAGEVLATLRSGVVSAAPGVAAAAEQHARVLAADLTRANEALQRANRHIDGLLEGLQTAAPPTEGQPVKQRDATILASLPGVGRIVLATLLAEAPQALRQRDYHALRCLCGVAPVTIRSGQSRRVRRRTSCNQRLAKAVCTTGPGWPRSAIRCRRPSTRRCAGGARVTAASCAA